MKRAENLALLVLLCLLPAGCIVELEKVVPDRASPKSVIDLRDPVGGSLWAPGTVFFNRLEAPRVLNWDPEDVFVEVPEGVWGEEVWVHLEINGLKSNPVRLSILKAEPLFGVVCFGDSIVYGGVAEALQGIADGDPYLGEMRPAVINQGKPMELVSGDATRSRLTNALVGHDPDLVILLEGANDVKDIKAVSSIKIREAVTGLADEVSLRGADLILCTLLPRVGSCGDVLAPTTEEHNAWLTSFAAGRGIPLVDLYQGFVSTPGWEEVFFDSFDCIHPNPQGTRKIAELLAARIAEVYLSVCTDNDGDGYGDPAAASCPEFGRDCDDGDPDVHPAETEPSCDNALDDDCDGLTDGQDPDCTPAGSCADPAEAAERGAAPVMIGASGLPGRLACLFLPAGLAVLWRTLRRRVPLSSS
jgi:lysophospholipase L1-like esterase